MQAASPGMFNNMQGFLMSMVGLSVACERVTETMKEWFCPTPQPAPPNPPSLKRSTVQFIAIVSGMLVTALSTLDPLGITHDAYKSSPINFGDPRVYLNWAVTGILVSGGSAFWNHLLDILQATKVQRESAAVRATAAVVTGPAKQVVVSGPGAAQQVGAGGD